jgi:glycosyltransferase involved in cell wall biosynthesis
MTANSVSVVMPTYNAEGFVAAALDSVNRQDMRPAEVVVVDDGSNDGTVAAVQAWQRTASPDFVLQLVTQANSGASAARNAGISRATSTWVALLDADDLWEPNHLAVLMDAAAKAGDVVAAYGGGRVLAGDWLNTNLYDAFWDNPSERFGVPLSEGSAYRRIDFTAFDRLARGNFIKPSSLMVSREAALSVGLFNTELRSAEDREFLIRLLRAGDFVYSPEAITQYRWHDDNLSHGKNARRNSENGLRALKTIYDNHALALTLEQRASCRRVVVDAAVGYLYLSIAQGWRSYREGVSFLVQGFGAAVALRAMRPRHLAKLLLQGSLFGKPRSDSQS